MPKSIQEIIEYDSESHALDFKEVQYPLGNNQQKLDLLKDISSMANHPSDEDKFIIVGVIEENGIATAFKNLSELIDEAQYQEFVTSNIEPKINFEYKRCDYKGHQLAYFRIFKNHDRPYLFSKEIRSINDSARIQFRPGEGFIRQGSSTRNLVRNDLEVIYKNRYKRQDRKSDLIVTCHSAKSEIDKISEYELDYFDITIENTSSSSISMDVELKIFKTDTVKIVADFDLLKEIQQQEFDKQKGARPWGIVSSYPTFSFDVSVNYYHDHVLVNRNRRLGVPTAISIPQHDKETDIFCQNLIIVNDSAGEITGELIIRSDDFVDGLMRYPVSFQYSKA